MVYESDFYTTRRPYSRPTVTSYSVTLPRTTSSGFGKLFGHNIPYVAHMRMTTPMPPPRTSRVRPSVIVAEIDRITHKMRPCISYQPTEDYLNSRSMVSFDDETKSIRAKTAALLRKIHEPLPRSRRPLPVIEATRYDELPIPERITSDTYILRMLGSSRSVADEIKNMSYYSDPARRTLGKGHLACVSFAGGRGFPRRRNLVRDPDETVKNDVTFLSHYERMRDAANSPHIPQGTEEEPAQAQS